MSLYYMNRKTKELELENVEGFKLLSWLYNTKKGTTVLEKMVKRKVPTFLYGKFQDTPLSAKKIRKMVHKHNINLHESALQLQDFKTFNDFFTRKLKEDARPIDPCDQILSSPSDGRIFAYENIDVERVVQIKGITYKLADLLEDEKLAKMFSGGTCIVIRLSPVDYHRFHYPASGMISDFKKIKGRYYSVNPIALKEVAELYVQNKRELTVIESDFFSTYVMVEVGATFVGSIVQNQSVGSRVIKGEEKGYFKFGGSTVILFFKQGEIELDPDLIEHTKAGYETKVNMGERIAYKSFVKTPPS